jgi:hypothetical protein
LAFVVSFFLAPAVLTAKFDCAVQEASAADYETLMREGIALRRSGDDEGALRHFEEAYGVSKTPKALAQIGLAEQALGRWGHADRHLRQALESEGDPWILKNRASINEALSVIAAHVGQLQVMGVPAGAEVRIDSQLIGKLPLSGPTTVTAGGVAIEVRAAGFLPIVRAATVAPRTLTRETFTLQALSPASGSPSVAASSGPAPSKAAPPADAGLRSAPPAEGDVADTNAPDSPSDVSPPAVIAGGNRKALVLTSTGLSIAAVALGVFEHISWQRKVDSFSAMPICQEQGSQACKQLQDDGERARVLAFVGYGLGAAFAITALVLYLTDSGRAPEPSKVACGPATLGTGVGCALRF